MIKILQQPTILFSQTSIMLIMILVLIYIGEGIDSDNLNKINQDQKQLDTVILIISANLTNYRIIFQI